MKKNLYLINLQVGRGTSDMPENLAGAFVPCFAAAVDPETAARKIVSSVSSQGYEFIGITDNKVHQLDSATWDTYVKNSWPEFSDIFPTQEQIQSGLESGFLFFGPFAGYESKHA